MALRYLLTVHSTPLAQPITISCAAGWHSVELGPAVQLCVSGPEVISATSRKLAILGHLFQRSETSEQIRHLDETAERRLLSSRGHSLITDFWGGYLAVICTAPDRVDVLRDPSATLPCYFTETATGHAFASDPEVLVDHGLLMPDVDWTELSRHLFASDVRNSPTCLKGLFELPAGFSASLTAGTLHLTSCWSPWEHTTPDPFVSEADEAEALHGLVERCTGAWGRAFRRPLLGVSGGLDSSIVASSLKAGGTPFIAYTVATDEADGDERRYARQLTDALGLDLIETFHTLRAVSIEAPTSSHLPRPIGHAFGHSLLQIKFGLAREQGADAFFTGVGGDNVFCFTQSASSLVDRWRSGGTLSDLQTTLTDICRLTGCSIWQALMMAGQRTFRPPAYRFTGDATFLNRDVSDDALAHLWLKPPKGYNLPGKAAHVGMMARIMGTIDGFDRNQPPDIRPLLSQPIVEACLRIPMWSWIAGGRNRSVARRAFKDRLPNALIDRTSKGGPNSFAFAVMDHFKADIRDRLLTGRLAERGLINPHRIAQALASDTYLRAPDHMRLSLILEAENWVRHWETVATNKRTVPPKLA